MLLQIDPEQLRMCYQIRNFDSHLFQIRKREKFLVFPSPLHPDQCHAGFGFFTLKDVFHTGPHTEYLYFDFTVSRGVQDDPEYEIPGKDSPQATCSG
jgi:hypothetical protein